MGHTSLRASLDDLAPVSCVAQSAKEVYFKWVWFLLLRFAKDQTSHVVNFS